MTDENYEACAQAHLASLKRDMRVSLEDAVVRAVHKVWSEFEANSDHQLMENAQGDLERIKLVQTGVGIGKPEQELCGACGGSGRVPRDPDIGTDQECFVCDGSGQQPKDPEQEPVAWMDKYGEIYKEVPELLSTDTPLYTTPPQRKPLTGGDERRHIICLCPDCIKTPQRKPLPCETLRELWCDALLANSGSGWFVISDAFARVIEAAHGIKE